jgi:hypothetical protein
MDHGVADTLQLHGWAQRALLADLPAAQDAALLHSRRNLGDSPGYVAEAAFTIRRVFRFRGCRVDSLPFV